MKRCASLLTSVVVLACSFGNPITAAQVDPAAPRPAASTCAAAAEIIDKAQQGPLQDALPAARNALQACDAYETWLFLGNVHAARKEWTDAENAYLRARGRAGTDPRRLTHAELRYALMAAEGRPACEGLAALEVARASLNSRGLPIPPALAQRQQQIEQTLAGSTVSADTIGCVLDAKNRAARLFLSERAFCTAISIDLPIHFDTASHALNAAATGQVTALVDALRTRLSDGDRLQIVGHTDERGSDAYNLALSNRRAATVSQELRQTLTLEASRLQPVGQGERQPKYPGSSEDVWRLNRRVEVTLLPPGCSPGEGA